MKTDQKPIKISTAKLATLSRYLSPKLFDIWRTLVFVFSIQMFICNFILFEKSWHLQIRYLTTWGCILHTVTFTLLFILQKLGVSTNEENSSFAQKFWSFTILVYEIAFSIAFPITIVYWLAIWPTDNQLECAYDHFLNVEIHGMTLLSFLTDFFLSSFLFKRNHFKYIGGVMLAYMLMNLVVTLLDEPVYQVINWKDTLSYVFGTIAFLLSIGSFKVFSRISYKRYLKLQKKLLTLKKMKSVQGKVITSTNCTKAKEKSD